MTDITTTAPYLVLTGVISYLFKLVLERCYRAERQVDTLLPAMTTLVEQARGLREEQAKTAEQVRTLREELTREQGRNR